MTLKEDLIKKAKDLGIQTDKMTIAQLKEAISEAESSKGSQPLDTPTPEAEKSATFAKAGRHSRKEVEAAAAEAERQARKEEKTDLPEKPKVKLHPPRPRSERRSKKYKQVVSKIDKAKIYEVSEALEVIVQTSTTKFDSSIDLVVSLGVNPKQSDHQIRDFVVLPSGSGKKVKVAVFAEDDDAKAALAAGATVTGKELFLQELEKGNLNFDILITTPQLMVLLSKYAKILGPKGLMPNPKSGTITKNVAKTVKEALSGRIEYKLNENSLIHVPVGKVSFSKDQLKANYEVVMESLRNNKPANLKGTYIQNAYLSTTMGPSIRISVG